MISFAIMRHGEAQPYAPFDNLRELTEQGKERIHVMAQQIRKEQGATFFQHIVSSPYLRAQQTAKIMADYFAIESFAYNSHLTPNGDLTQAVNTLETMKNHTLIVSHMPMVNKLASYWIDGVQSYDFPFGLNELLCLNCKQVLQGLSTEGKKYV